MAQPRHWYVALLATLLTCSGCQLDRRRCDRAMKHNDWRAAIVCTAAFERGDVQAGEIATRALAALGRYDEVLRLAQRLLSTTERAAALRMMGRIHDRQGDVQLARQELRGAMEAAITSGDHVNAGYDALALGGAYSHGGQYRDALAALTIANRQAELAAHRELRGYAAVGVVELLSEIGAFEPATAALAVHRDRDIWTRTRKPSGCTSSYWRPSWRWRRAIPRWRGVRSTRRRRWHNVPPPATSF